MDETTKRRYRECAAGVVQRGHMCGGCLAGQFVCGVFELWHAAETARREEVSGMRITWEADNQVVIEFLN